MIPDTLAGLVDVAGPADAPAIVLLHGIGATRRQWAPQLRTLSDTHRLVATDLPGHGAFGEDRFNFNAAVTHVERVIDTVAGGRAMLVGLSLGGYVAITLAGRSPERVAGMVLTGCSGNPHGLLTAVPTGMALFARVVGEGWYSCINKRHFRHRYGDDSAREQIDAGLSFTAAQDALWEIAGRDVLRDLRAYTGPTLFLNGERDAMFRVGEVYFLGAAQDARLQLVRGAGHVANLEQPAAYDNAIRAFARSIEW